MRPRHMVFDVYLFLAAVFGTLAASRVLSLIIPSEFYFTFQSLFSDRPPQNLIVALFSKMTGPLVCGFVLGWFTYGRAISAAGPTRAASGFKRRLRLQWSPTVFLGGFSAAFLSAWPIIIYWDLLSNPAVTHLKWIFFVLYVIYMLGYGYVALLGFLGAVFVKEHLAATGDAAKLVSLPELSRVGALWVLNSGIASAALEAITK